ncbi:MAG: hypothetical protein D6780_06150, partial [Candidatus Dadabacteria bacterium]
GELYTLVREEVPLLYNKELALKKKIIFPIAENITHFKLEILNSKDGSWNSVWGESSNRVNSPSMIFLDIGFKAEEEESFQIFISTER